MTRRCTCCKLPAFLATPENAICFAAAAQFFDVVDADHSGEIDVHELQRALALGDLNFSLSIVAHMIRRAYRNSFLV